MNPRSLDLFPVPDPDFPERHIQKLADGALHVRAPRLLDPVDCLIVNTVAETMADELWVVQIDHVMPVLALAALRPEASISCIHYDISRLDAASQLAQGNEIENIEFLCNESLPTPETSPTLAMMTVRLDDETGQVLETLRHVHDRLRPGGHLIVSINQTHDRWLGKQLEAIFGNLTLLAKAKHGWVYSVKRRGRDTLSPIPAEGQPDYFVKEIEVFFEGEHLPFETAYGTFSFNDIDDSSRALLEMMEVLEPGSMILDLGCGWGAMGLLASQRCVASRLTMIDANLRAVTLARRNAKRLELGGVEVRHEANALSVTLPGEVDAYDVVVTNPPSGVDFSVARMFIERAHTALRGGGLFYLVAKHNPTLIQWVEEAFGEVEVKRRRSFDVLVACKKSSDTPL